MNVHHPMCLLGTLLLVGQGCARANTPATRTHVSQETTFRDSSTALVRFVDAAERTLVLESLDGDVMAVEAGEGVDLTRFQPGDMAQLRYEELISLTEGGPEAAATVDLQSRVRQLPAGIQLGRSVTTAAQIVVVARDGSQVTLRGPNDAMSTVDLSAPANQRRAARLEPGDTVTVTVTETLDVSVGQAASHATSR